MYTRENIMVMVSAVQCFIHHATDKEVDIAFPKNRGQLKTLDKMYNEATKHIWQK